MRDPLAHDVELYAICVVHNNNTSTQGHYLYCCVISRFLQNTFSRYRVILLQQTRRSIYFIFKTSVTNTLLGRICVYFEEHLPSPYLIRTKTIIDFCRF